MSGITRRCSRLAAAVLLLLGSCSSTPRGQDDDGNAPPFVFRSLNLRQQDMFGRPTWSLTSPEARYDMRRRVAQADRPRGEIFRRGKAAFRLSATSGTVLNEGEVVLLEGRIRVEQLGENPLLIRAERARWFPSRNRLEIDRRPEVLDRSNRISARHAGFAFDTQVLRLRDQPRLEHWRQRHDPAQDVDRGRPEIVMTVEQADWNTASGDLTTKGPVRAERGVPDRPKGAPAQTLTASVLEGNTHKQSFWLRGPVHLQDPQDASEMRSGDLLLDLQTSQASTGSQFLAQAGGPFVSSGCWLQRSGDSLQAENCRWNWVTQAVEASGNVQLRRREHDQSSLGGLLSGRLGRDGSLILTNPRGRVITRLHLPRGSRPVLRPQLRQPRSAAQPIRL